MRAVTAKLILSCFALSCSAAALPRPLVGDNANSTVFPGDNSYNDADTNSLSGAGRGASGPHNSAAPAALTAATSDANDSSTSSDPAMQDAVASDDTTLATSLTQAETSKDPPGNARHQSANGNITHIDLPAELTGQLLGMLNCSGIFYNPKWDRCDETTGQIISKTPPNGKREAPKTNARKPSAFSRSAKARDLTQAYPDAASEHERDPSILDGVAGVDDGAMPRTNERPPTTRREAPRSPTYGNIPFGGSDISSARLGTEPSSTSDLNKRNDPTNTPGNINFWNTPFDLPQEQSNGQAPNGGKFRRQGAGANDLEMQSGPLSGEDQVLDGALPYIHDNPANTKRQGKESPSVEIGPPGAGGARNIIINKRQNETAPTGSSASANSNDPTGYLSSLGHSSNGLNYEAPSKDPATPPNRLGKRAQPDFDYVRPLHVGGDIGTRAQVIRRDMDISKRQNANSSKNAQSEPDQPSGFLGNLGAEEAAAARAGAPFIPPHLKPRRDMA